MEPKQNRTISYIYGLDIEKSSRLASAIVTGTMRTTSCVYQWLNGRRKPCFLECKFVQEKVKEIYGLEVPLEELFPRIPRKNAAV